MKKLSIIIPVFNEEKTIRKVLERINQVKLKRIKKEIIIVDDHSIDQTPRILSKIEGSIKTIQHSQNMGKGAAVRSGLNIASGDFIIVQDADLEYNPSDYEKLLEPIIHEKYDVVYGTRLKNYPLNLWGRHKTVLPTHLIGNRFVTMLTNLLYGANISDMETGYKLFRKEVIKELKLRSNRFDIEPEITAKLLKSGFKIYEVPIKVIPRTHKQGKKINWRDGIVAVWTLIKYRFGD